MSSVELVNCHTHTIFSDGASTLEENMEAALAAGITTVACTDHWGKPDFIDCSIKAEKLSEYFERIASVRKLYPTLEIISGIEADWYHGCENDLRALRTLDSLRNLDPLRDLDSLHDLGPLRDLDSLHDFGSLRDLDSLPTDPKEENDFRPTFFLGSIHYLQEKPIDWDEHTEIWEELGANALWCLYVKEWCQAATSGLFDSMAHPDLPRMFSTEGYCPTIDLTPLYKEMAEAAHAGKVHVEINTAGLIKSFKDFYPHEALLTEFFKAGVPLTIGSDAHHASRMGDHILEAYRYARSIGYTQIDVPTTTGNWRQISLENLK